MCGLVHKTVFIPLDSTVGAFDAASLYYYCTLIAHVLHRGQCQFKFMPTDFLLF